jgi:lysophospholipase L1-like esterase
MLRGNSRKFLGLMVVAVAFMLALLAMPHREAAQTQRRGIENPRALNSFFRALDDLKSGRRIEPVRIAHYGDSHTAADILTAEIRHRFQYDFGDGGPGYIVPRNPFSTPRRGADSGATPGWTVDGVGKNSTNDGFYGLAGFSLSTDKKDETIWLKTTCNHFEVYFLKWPGGGTIDIAVDGASILDKPLSLNSDLPQPDYQSYDTPANSEHRIEIRTVTPGRVRILGIVAEHIAPGPGISYDVLGINGARAVRLLSWNRTVFVDNLVERKPDLIIVAYGTNEVTDNDWSVESYARMLSGILKDFRRAAPDASIIVFGPPDRTDVESATNKMPLMIEAQRRAAREAGAAFWSSYDAMGGAGSMNAWISQGLGREDHVHLTAPGYVKLGGMFYEDFSHAYAESKPRNSANTRTRKATRP